MKKSLVIATAAFATSCAAQSSGPTLAQTTGCEALGGHAIEIVLHDYYHPFKVTWTHTGISSQQLPPGEESAKIEPGSNHYNDSRGPWDSAVSEVPRHVVAGNELSTPYLVSPNHQQLLASAYPMGRDGRSYIPSLIALIDMRSSKPVTTIPIAQPQDGMAWLESFAWNPSSSAFAVISVSQVEGAKSLKALISPHPVLYMTFSATVYDAAGKARCSTTIARDITSGTATIAWR